MNTFAKFLPLGLLFAACGTMRETTQVRDDVYDIPDRTVVASVTPDPAQAGFSNSPQPETDYYDAGEARSAGVSRDYYDMTYNDPYYYNYGRFGFGASVGGWGPGYGMGLSYGWPTSWGSMSVGYGFGMGYSPWGYNPYWGNSWMSGYGYGDPWGYYGYNPYGYYGYGGYGWSPYRGPWGGCYGCYEPIGYSNNVVYGHRPSMTGSSGGMNTAQEGVRRMVRNPAGLMPATESVRPSAGRPGRVQTPGSEGRRNTNTIARPSRNEVGREARPARGNWNFGSGDSPSRGGGGGSSPSRSGGGGGGGGRTTSPRPR